MSGDGDYEDGRMPAGRHPAIPHGSQIIPFETQCPLDPLERMAYQLLFDTILDCYMVGTGKWQHFRREGWHDKNEAERIWHTASARVIDWVNSDRFAFYVQHFGWDRMRARTMLCEVLNGRHDEKIKELLDKPHNPTGKGGFTKRG